MPNRWDVIFLGGKREANGERGALADLASGGDGSTQGLHQMLDDAQAQPGSSELAASGLVHAIEALENPRQVLLRNAHPSIGHLQDDFRFFGKPAQGDAAAG